MFRVLAAMTERFLAWRDKPFSRQEVEEGFSYIDKLDDDRMMKYPDEEHDRSVVLVLMEAFAWDEASAHRMLALWRRTYSQFSPSSERAALACAVQSKPA